MKKIALNLVACASILACASTSLNAVPTLPNLGDLKGTVNVNVQGKFDTADLSTAIHTMNSSIDRVSSLITQLGFAGAGLGLTLYSMHNLKKMAFKSESDTKTKPYFSDRTLGLLNGVGLATGLGLIYFSGKLARV